MVKKEEKKKKAPKDSIRALPWIADKHSLLYLGQSL